MNMHTQHYNDYLIWKRKALYITLGVIVFCVIVHSITYIKLLKLQSALSVTLPVESSVAKSEPDCAKIVEIIENSDKNPIFAWLSTLVQALPAHVKIEEFEYTTESCTITLIAKDRATYISCLERFDTYHILNRLRVEKQYVKDKQYCFIMKI